MPAQPRSIKMSDKEISQFRKAVHDWYAKHARELPWRYRAGETPDPYRVWLSEIMLQQTTVTAVKPYFEKFTAKWPDIHALANADRDEIMAAWAGLGYYSRARNLHKCANEILNNSNGLFPNSQKKLKELSGIGDYTSAAITSIAFNQPAVVMDANIERIFARILTFKETFPKGKRELKQQITPFFAENFTNHGDFAQALMDIGSAICTVKSPKCTICPVSQWCKAHKLKAEEKYPKKEKKKAKPTRYGNIYFVKNHKNEILLEKRPDKGLLAGMMALPTTDWIENKSVKHLNFLEKHNPERIPSSVKHSFTHFDLILTLYTINMNKPIPYSQNFTLKKESDINDLDFPTVFRKAFRQFYK